MQDKKITYSQPARLVDVIPLSGVDETYTYKINNFTIKDLTGYRVLIPFGNRKITGIIIKEHLEPLNFPKEKLKPIIRILDSNPIISKEIIELCFWISNYYVTPLGEVFRAIIPPKLSTKEEIYIQLTSPQSPKIPSLDKKELKIIEALGKTKSPQSLKNLKKILKIRKLESILNELEKKGIISLSRRFSGKIPTKKVIRFNKNMFTLENCEAFGEIYKRRKKILELLEFFYEKVNSNIDVLPVKELQKEFPTKNLNQYLSEFELAGFINVVYLEETGGDFQKLFPKEYNFQNELQFELNDEQKLCLESINSTLEKGKFNSFLLFGVTGSGKTLVYMHAIKKCLEQGKSAIVLVPEISLTPQLIERFNNAFPDNIAVLHSRLTISQRIKQWVSIWTGEKKIVVGPRSGIFAPTKNLGLIIVDEEHEPTYKQEEPQPRYNARDVALMRGKIENAVVVLGSANPSVTSYFSATKGKHKLLRIQNRADGAQLPNIILVDILEKRRQKKMFGQFSDTLIHKIIDRLTKREGIILFQNRRGFGLILECRSCGYIPKCPECEISLTYHKVDQKLKCHYCGYEKAFESTCPKCGKPTMLILGYGTQRIEEDLNSLLNELNFYPRIARFDLDVVLNKQNTSTILKDFYNGEIDILIGTQLIAKGLDFERVTLVGIINADLQLNIPDFSANERSFQLFTQVAGRAGRRSLFPGEVVIQTSEVDSYTIKSFLNQDYESFYETEIKFRKELNYPPFARLISIEIRSYKSEIEQQVLDFVIKYIEQLSFGIILGPVTPLITKLRGWHRKVILMKVPKSQDPNLTKTISLLKFLSKDFNKKYNPQKNKLIIDVDSQFSLF